VAIAESISKDIIINDYSGQKYNLDLINRLNDPLLKWNVHPAIDFKNRVYGNITANNQTLYLCDDVLCFPIRFSSYLSWFDPTANNVGSRVFDKSEAWDHTNETNPNTSAPYNGWGWFFAGYRSYMAILHLTDGTSKVQINIIRRYTDNSILIFNTGKDGTTNVNITVRVYDPPSAFGYAVDTNGTRGSGYTDIAPGKYVLFYAGAKPSVDATNGVFATSPMGSSKSLSYELYVNSMSSFKPAGFTAPINIPKVYLGIKAPSDMEIGSNGSYIRVFRNTQRWIGLTEGFSSARDGYNVSGMAKIAFVPFIEIYDADPYATSWAESISPLKIWTGWAEDENGNVKFIVSSHIKLKHDVKWSPRFKSYSAVIYDVDRDEEYEVGIIKPLIDIFSYGEEGAVVNPFITGLTIDLIKSNAIKYIDTNDTLNTKTSPSSSVWEYNDGYYGFCEVFNDKIACAEGIGLYTNDTNLSISDPKSAWGFARNNTATDTVGGVGPRIIPWNQKQMLAGKLYIAVARLKQLPSTASDSDITAWFKQITPIVLNDADISGLFNVLPYSIYLFGQNTDQISITAPSSAIVGSNINIQISAPNRPNKSVWVAIVDANGNVVVKGSGTLDSSGNATITLTAPSNTGTYRIVAIVAGDRMLP